MDDVEYRKMSEMEDTAWWFRGKRAVVANMIARFAPGERRLRGLDVGCGTGTNLALLGRFGAAHRSLSRASALALPYPARAFGVVALLDMLYHRRVNDVTRSLTEVARVCRPGGLLVITDSAFEFLKGPHDVAYHTARRFRRHELAQLVAASGSEIPGCSSANTLLFPLAVGVRFFERLRFGPAQAHSSLGQPSRVANAVLGGVYGLEARLLRHVSMPFGLSVLVVARRTAAVGKRYSSTL